MRHAEKPRFVPVLLTRSGRRLYSPEDPFRKENPMITTSIPNRRAATVAAGLMVVVAGVTLTVVAGLLGRRPRGPAPPAP
jgi:hypothetical protein